jgi:prolyl-tRNA editing enzyme YbaK/EbsC (Cys-tRNA(Pro) deacylase)
VRGALDVHQALLAADVPHEIVRLDTRITSADELPRALGLDAGCLAVRCYRATGDDGSDAFAAVLVPAGATPEPGALLLALAARAVRPALAGEVNLVTDCAAGLVTPVALPPQVVLLADAAVGGTDVVYTAVGEGGLALGIRTRDLLVTTGARVATLTSAPADTGAWGPELDVDAGVLDVDLDRVQRLAL